MEGESEGWRVGVRMIRVEGSGVCVCVQRFELACLIDVCVCVCVCVCEGQFECDAQTMTTHLRKTQI